MKFQQRSGHCVETGSQSGRGWLEGGDGEEEREGDLAGPQGSSHILSLSLPLSLSPPALLLSVPLPLLSVFLSIPRRRRRTPGLASAPPLAMAWRNPGGRGLGRSTLARWSPASLGAGAADKRPLCQLKKRLSQDPPSPPNTGSAGLRAKEGCLWITRVFSSPLLWFIASLRTQGNSFSKINIPL